MQDNHFIFVWFLSFSWLSGWILLWFFEMMYLLKKFKIVNLINAHVTKHYGREVKTNMIYYQKLYCHECPINIIPWDQYYLPNVQSIWVCITYNYYSNIHKDILFIGLLQHHVRSFLLQTFTKLRISIITVEFGNMSTQSRVFVDILEYLKNIYKSGLYRYCMYLFLYLYVMFLYFLCFNPKKFDSIVKNLFYRDL